MYVNEEHIRTWQVCYLVSSANLLFRHGCQRMFCLWQRLQMAQIAPFHWRRYSTAFYFMFVKQVFMVPKSWTKILISPKILPTRFFFTFYGNKILSKSFQDFQMAGNVLSWQNLSLRFSNGGCDENLDAARLINCTASFLGDKQKTLETQKCTRWLRCSDSQSCCRCDPCTEPESGGWFWGWGALVLICHQQKRTFGGWERRSRGGGIETNTWHRPGDMASEEAGEFECCPRWAWSCLPRSSRLRLPFSCLVWHISVHYGSGQACVFGMYPRRWSCLLGSRAKMYTLWGRHTRFVGDSTLHTYFGRAPLHVGETAEEVVLPSATNTEFDSI